MSHYQESAPKRHGRDGLLYDLAKDGRIIMLDADSSQIMKHVRQVMRPGDTFQQHGCGRNTYESMRAYWDRHDAAVKRDRVRFGF